MVKSTRLRYGIVHANTTGKRFETKTKRSILAFPLSSFIIALLLSLTAAAQVPDQCGGVNCTSNDVAVTGAKIADASGNLFKCSKGTPVSGAYLFLTVSSNAPRVGVFISLTLNIEIDGTTTSKPIQHCFTGATLNGSNNILPLPLEENLFKCGAAVTLSDVFTAWGTGNTDFCAGSTDIKCPSTKSKCRFVKGVANFVQTTPCTGATINQDPTPTSNTQCAGGSASFTAKFLQATSPSASTYKWQVCTGNCETDASWSDVANINVTGSSYTEANSLASGERTTTLTISNLTTSFNGYKYRVLITNVSSEEPDKPCPAQTTAATLNVDAAPSAASVGSHQKICGSLKSNSLGGNTPSTGTGTWSKKSGPGVVTFSAEHTGSSTAEVTLPGTYEFTWTISNGVCTSTTADITVNFYNLPSDPGGNVTAPTCSNANGTVIITAPLDGNNIDYEYRNGSGDWSDDVAFTVAAGATYSIVARNKATGCVSANAYSGTMAMQPATPLTPTFTNTHATCSAGGSITITNYSSKYTYVLTGPSPATTTQNLTASTAQNIAAGNYTLTASLTTGVSTCTSPAANISIGTAAGVPDAPVIGVKQNATCSSAAMIIEVTSLTPISDYEFRNGSNGTWQSSNEFTINAGSGYEIYARRKSDNTCVSAPQTCTPVQSTTASQKNTGEAASIPSQKARDINARIGSKTKVLAAPNPFSDKVRFTLEAEVSGQGSLEIYNTLGQRMATLYHGHVEAGKVLVKEYTVPASRRTNLIYVFRVGDQTTTGKLLNW